MAQVTIRLEKWLEGQTIHPSILTRVYPLDRPPADAAKPLGLMIPAGPTSGIPLDLRPGNYLFEAYLPNGDIATTTATVSGDGNEVIVLRATESPHEWLSWQHLTGYEPEWRPSGRSGFAKAVKLDVVYTDQPPRELREALLDAWRKGAPPKLPWKTVEIAPRPGATVPMVDPALSVTAYLYPGGGGWQQNVRYYGLVAHPPAGAPLLAALPLPWPQADFSGDADADVIVDARDAKAERRDWPIRVSAVARDNIMAPILGYLSSGDAPAAGRVAEQAVDRLYQKVANPRAAAGGAYALVRLSLDPKASPAWVPWLANLRRWFPWLADGSILDGWAWLNGIARAPTPSEAAEAFVEATERGLPLYSEGVRLLFEGLTRVEALLIAPSRPADFSAALEFARRMALRVDLRQPFTVVRLR